MDQHGHGPPIGITKFHNAYGRHANEALQLKIAPHNMGAGPAI